MRNVHGDLDARLAEAEIILSGAGAWGVPYRGEEAPDSAGAELSERVAGLLWAITLDHELSEVIDDVTSLAMWLAVGYENMALAPPGRPVVPPSLAAFDRLGWSGEALSRVADELGRLEPPECGTRGRKRHAARGVPDLIARLREASARRL